MYSEIVKYCSDLALTFDKIPAERKEKLLKIADCSTIHKAKNVSLLYVCTHNARRSHFGQIWANVAAQFYGITTLKAFSAGTELTAFHPNAVKIFTKIGFKVSSDNKLKNPTYTISFGEKASVTCFSKTMQHPTLPSKNFIAIMTCDDAEKNCPFLPGALCRFPLTYKDPKVYDGTALADEKYFQTSETIARESLYLFSLL